MLDSFLEAALDDKDKAVRKLAATLLGFLPASPLVARMTARADALVTFKKGGLLKRATLRFVLPDETDPNGARDGLDIRAFGLQPKLSARAIILVQIVAAVPLAHWFEKCRLAPAALLATVLRSVARPRTPGVADACAGPRRCSKRRCRRCRSCCRATH